MHRLISHIRHNLVAWLALFVALGGTGYAAVAIPRNSVGAAQLRNHSIDPVKLNPRTIGGSVRAWADIAANGTVLAGSGHPKVELLSTFPGSYVIDWSVNLPADCATVANVDGRSTTGTTVSTPGGPEQVVSGYVSQVQSGSAGRPVHGHRPSGTGLITFNQNGQPTPLAFDVAVIC